MSEIAFARAVIALRVGSIATKARIPVVSSAQGKLASLAEKFETTIDKILEQGLKGKRFRDLDNSGNINIFTPRPDGRSGFLRITLDPRGDRVISAGLNKLRDVSRGIEKGRFQSLD